jgi:5-carboxymethyl-2-hydroxymuconate isomerase
MTKLNSLCSAALSETPLPHRFIEGSQSLTQLIAPGELLRLVEAAAAATNLSQSGEVKLRLSLYEHFSVGGTQEDCVYLIFYILAGRTDEQKRLLSRRIARAGFSCSRRSGCSCKGSRSVAPMFICMLL